MKHKLWNTKNSFGGRTLVNKDFNCHKETFMLGQKATIYGHPSS